MLHLYCSVQISYETLWYYILIIALPSAQCFSQWIEDDVYQLSRTVNSCIYVRAVSSIYLIDVVGVGSSALQEHRGDPHVDESAMSPEWQKQQAVLIAVVIITVIIIITGSSNINSAWQHYAFKEKKWKRKISLRLKVWQARIIWCLA